MKKIFLIAAIAILALGTMAFMAISTKAAAPTGTLTGTPITINIGERAALPTLTVTAPNPSDITDEHDIRIWAIHIGTQVIWDESVTTFTPGGTAAEKVSGSITYEKYLGSAENVVAMIEVISDFDPGDTLEINGLGLSLTVAAAWAKR
ncbi:MAG TPA: hypothetical protein PKG74_02335 [Candidatus Colwellbacteria bacterium]|nr:hypothetical protein [Candidatus Colwellbacteria bacterium]